MTVFTDDGRACYRPVAAPAPNTPEAMMRVRAAVTVLVVLFVLISSVRGAWAQSTDQKEAQSFVSSLAEITYAAAWPTATYKTWRLRGVERVVGGLDIGVRLSGISAFDNGELWLDLVFQLRNGSLYDFLIVDHNAILAQPFSTIDGVLRRLKAAADEHAKNSAARAPSRPPAPSADRSGEGLCLHNPTVIAVKFSYRWGASEWTAGELPTRTEQWFSYPLQSAGQAAPAFEVRFDNNLAEGYTNTQYTLKSSPARLPLGCRDVFRYDFRLDNQVLTMVASPTP
jgi:hypothetical protein